MQIEVKHVTYIQEFDKVYNFKYGYITLPTKIGKGAVSMDITHNSHQSYNFILQRTPYTESGNGKDLKVRAVGKISLPLIDYASDVSNFYDAANQEWAALYNLGLTLVGQGLTQKAVLGVVNDQWFLMFGDEETYMAIADEIDHSDADVEILIYDKAHAPLLKGHIKIVATFGAAPDISTPLGQPLELIGEFNNTWDLGETVLKEKGIITFIADEKKVYLYRVGNTE